MKLHRGCPRIPPPPPHLRFPREARSFSFLATPIDCAWDMFRPRAFLSPANRRRISGRRFSPSEKRPEIRLRFAGYGFSRWSKKKDRLLEEIFGNEIIL